ncbi:bifunctional DNA primase/polymerase [Frankia sp. Cas3]|uniref:bifunctional DNA primase/polymerase n=1 Tax=Frankia sp. Cas3 TaxID=3073926 RepID=UPI002AD3CEF0|nr:bifunctional DNA primase/polymerase [Frankia sp. Cas3]
MTVVDGTVRFLPRAVDECSNERARSSTRDAARELHDAGLCLIPVAADGTKRPDVAWAPFLATRSTPDQHDQWFGTGRPVGIGVVYGKVSGNIEMIEFEGRAIAEGVLDEVTNVMHASGLGDVWQAITTGWVTRSPSGGLHFRVRIDGDSVPANLKLAARPARDDEYTPDERQRIAGNPHAQIKRILVETRGEGGYGIVEPSGGTVHASGKPYIRIAGSPAAIPTIDSKLMDAVRDICRTADRMPRPEPVRPSREPLPLPNGDLRPGDDYNLRADWAEILEPHGWTLVYHRDTRYWRRPGKDRGVSATTGHSPTGDRLYVFSTSTEFQAETPYTKFGAYTLLHHGGDYGHAAKALADLGYGTPRETRAIRRVPPHHFPVGDGRTVDTATGEIMAGPVAVEVVEAATEGSTSRDMPGVLPDAFWESHPILLHIRQAAHSRGCSSTLVLYGMLARLSGMLSHHIRAVTGIGGPASLNFFAALVGESGAGKSIAAALVRDLMPCLDEDFRDGMPLGSGEGIAEIYMGTVEEKTDEIHTKGPKKGEPVTRKVRKQVRHNAYFYADEGQSFTQLSERSGAILGESIRRAAIGETLGQTNATEERTRYIPAGSYSFGLLIGFQPSTARPLLADSNTGTPQRFFWGWESDPAMPDIAPPWPGEIDAHPGRRRPSGPLHIDFPERIKTLLWQDRVARVRNEIRVDRLDAHAGLMKVKAASLFALLFHHPEVTEADWELTEMLWQSSCAVRDFLLRRAEQEAEAERSREETGRVLQALRIREATMGADVRLERVLALACKHAAKVGGITFGALNKAVASRERKLVKDAVALGVTRGLLVVEGDSITVWTGG